MNRIHNPAAIPIDPRIGRSEPVRKSSGPAAASPAQGSAFQKILKGELQQGQGIRFSAHAQARLSDRDIEISDDALNKLTDAVDRAAAKGARDALVLMPGASRTDDLALVVSVTNRTVVTAMDGERVRDSIFTNIDSALVVH